MKKTKKLLILLTCTALSTAPAVANTAYAAATEYTVQTTSGVAAVGAKSTSTKASTAKKKKIKPGWYTYKSGNKRYYNKKGQYYTGLHRIGKYRYYFNSKGLLQRNKNIKISKTVTYKINKYAHVTIVKKKLRKGWFDYASGNKRYYDNEGKFYTGLHQIGNAMYYFNDRGFLLSNRTVTVGDVTYYIDELSHVTMTKEGSSYFRYTGAERSQLSDGEVQDLLANERAQQIVAQITNPGMSQEQKLQTCFNWVIRKYYYIWRRFDEGGEYWPAVNANDHFVYGRGDCMADASAFAYLAKALGYTNVYVCADAQQSNNNAHGWAEINGLVYDPLFAEAKSYSKYYGATYSSYRLSPILRYQLS